MSKQQAWMGAVVGLLGGLSVITVATDARADDVGNPGSFDFNVNPSLDSHIRFANPGPVIDLADGTNFYFFYADLDGDGTVSGMGSSFPVKTFNVGGTMVTAQLIFQSSSEGRVSVPNHALDFNTTRAKVRFTWPNLGSCNTAVFVIDLSTSHWSAGTQGVCSVGYDETTGEFCIVASGFVIPQLPAAACGNNGNAINSHFSLGLPGTYMQILGGDTNPTIVQ